MHIIKFLNKITKHVYRFMKKKKSNEVTVIKQS